jgi:hypothetical protein
MTLSVNALKDRLCAIDHQLPVAFVDAEGAAHEVVWGEVVDGFLRLYEADPRLDPATAGTMPAQAIGVTAAKVPANLNPRKK